MSGGPVIIIDPNKNKVLSSYGEAETVRRIRAMLGALEAGEADFETVEELDEGE